MMRKNREVWTGQRDGVHYSLHVIDNELWLLTKYSDGQQQSADKIENTPDDNKNLAALMLAVGTSPQTVAEVFEWEGEPTGVIWDGVRDADEEAHWSVISVAGRLFRKRQGADCSVWPATREDVVELLLRGGLSADQIAMVPDTQTFPVYMHPRDVAKERLQELGEHLVNDSLSGVLELLLRNISRSAEALAPVFLKHLEGVMPAAAQKPATVTSAPTNDWATVADSFDGGWLAGQIDACQTLAQRYGWTLPNDILLYLQTGVLMPTQVLQGLSDAWDGDGRGGSGAAGDLFERLRRGVQVVSTPGGE